MATASPSINNNHQSKAKRAGLILFCFTGICICYLCYGIILEELNASTRHKSITTFLLSTQSANNALFAYILNRWDSSWNSAKVVYPQDNDASSRTLNHNLLLLASFCYFAAMSCTNESLQYVTYPSATLAKSCKLIPTMLMGYYVEDLRYKKGEVVGVILITVGIVVFNLSRITSDASSEEERDHPFGIFLLIVSLLIDGMTNSCQGLLKRSSGNYRAPSTFEVMFWTNFYSLFMFFPSSFLLTNHWGNAMTLSMENTSLFLTFAKLNGLAMFGQICIFLTINNFSPLICTIITTTRKFFTILISVLKFGKDCNNAYNYISAIIQLSWINTLFIGHVFTFTQWSSIFMVFGGLFLQIIEKNTTIDKKVKLK